MQIHITLEPGSNAWVMQDNKAVPCRVRNVNINLKLDALFSAGYEETVSYTTDIGISEFNKYTIFATKEELLESL